MIDRGADACGETNLDHRPGDGRARLAHIGLSGRRDER